LRVVLTAQKDVKLGKGLLSSYGGDYNDDWFDYLVRKDAKYF
jgi:hypothetical protein